MARRPDPLTAAELEVAFSGEWNEKFPPVLSPVQLARLVHVPLKTVYAWSSEGVLDAAKFPAGKRVCFWRNRALAILHNTKRKPRKK